MAAGSVKKLDFHVHQGDCVDWMASLPDESVDLILTDPAYESLEKHRAKGTTARLANEWFEIFPNSRYPEFFREAYRILKKDRHFYLFCDQETMFIAKPIAEEAGFKFWKPIIWDKMRIGMGYHYRCRYECILFFEKGRRKLNNLSIPDILEAPRILGGYSTEKPVVLGEILVRQSTEPGEVVVDPFMGSGAFGAAALRNERAFAGCDKSPKSMHIAAGRLGGEGGRYVPQFADLVQGSVQPNLFGGAASSIGGGR